MRIDEIYSLAYRIIKCFDDTETHKAYPWEICKNVAELVCDIENGECEEYLDRLKIEIDNGNETAIGLYQELTEAVS